MDVHPTIVMESHPGHPDHPHIKISKEPTSEGLLDVLHPLNPKQTISISWPWSLKHAICSKGLETDGTCHPTLSELHRNHEGWNHYQHKVSSSKVFGCLSVPTETAAQNALKQSGKSAPAKTACRQCPSCRGCRPPPVVNWDDL